MQGECKGSGEFYKICWILGANQANSQSFSWDRCVLPLLLSPSYGARDWNSTGLDWWELLAFSLSVQGWTGWKPDHHLTQKIHPKSSMTPGLGVSQGKSNEIPHPGHKYSRFKQPFHSRVYTNLPPPFPITSSPRPWAGTRTPSQPHANPLQLNQLSQAPHSCRTPRIGSSGHLLFSTPTNMQAGVRHHHLPCSWPLFPRLWEWRHSQRGRWSVPLHLLWGR